MALTRLTLPAVPNLTTDKITSGTLDVGRIPDLSAAKITSGTIADGRIAASSVTQHAVSFDDNDIVNDISTLGLRVHTQENLVGSNTNSASFDVFQDSSKVTSLTNVTRDTLEYISSVYSTTSSFNFKTAGTNGEQVLILIVMDGQMIEFQELHQVIHVVMLYFFLIYHKILLISFGMLKTL